MQEIQILGITLQLLPEKAIYIEHLESLLISDVHLGKSETFQSFGIPISNHTNQDNLNRLHQLCIKFQPQRLFILGDLFHSRYALVDEVINVWLRFLNDTQIETHLILGNHDRHLEETLRQLSIHCQTTAIQLDRLILSHEPYVQTQDEGKSALNICGHIHPCLRMQTKLDRLRLPCFYLEQQDHRLTLPSFGEFTGGYEVMLTRNTAAYVIVEQSIVAFKG